MITGSLPTSYDDFALQQRARESLSRRQLQQRADAAAQGLSLFPQAIEQEDPNFGAMNVLSQGLDESTAGKKSRMQIPASLQALLRKGTR